jgi:secreted trypsin-like serine protease
VNGALAVRSQFPYQAAIIIDGASFCGGSLISTSAVLTAAHCAQGASFEVHLGALDLSLSTESGRISVTTTEKARHPDYNANNLNNDIAILKFDQPITPSSNTKI